MSHQLVCAALFSSRLEAELAKSLLESQGIKSFISADDAGGMRPGMFAYAPGVELIVREEDLEKAKELLKS